MNLPTATDLRRLIVVLVIASLYALVFWGWR